MASSLPSISPSYSTAVTYKPRILEVKLGDGYSQRSVDGINAVESTWNVVWDLLDSTDMNSLNTHFNERAGYQSFTWTPPGGTSQKFICKQWTVTPKELNQYSVNAVFERVFDL